MNNDIYQDTLSFQKYLESLSPAIDVVAVGYAATNVIVVYVRNLHKISSIPGSWNGHEVNVKVIGNIPQA